jgi:hypothetical protein
VGRSVSTSRLVTVPVHTAPGVAVAWQPYSWSLHMKENALLVMLGRVSELNWTGGTDQDYGYQVPGWLNEPRTARHGASGLPIVIRPGSSTGAR